MFWLKKEPNISQILLKLWLIGNRTSCHPIRSVIILVIKQIGLPLRGRPILLITRMITDRIGLHSVLLPLPIGMSKLYGYVISYIEASSFLENLNASEKITCYRFVSNNF